MKIKNILLLISLLFSTLPTHSQTNTVDWSIDWKVLKKEQGTSFNPNSPEALEIINNILESNLISKAEANILFEHYKKQGGKQAWLSVAQNIQNKSPFASAALKANDLSTNGWTQEMVDQNPEAAAIVVLNNESASQLKEMTWMALSNNVAAGIAQRFFKKYRKTLTLDGQIAATRNQQQLIIDKVNRVEGNDAWLLEISADLIALELNKK